MQAEFVAELKLRNINEEYILNRTKDIAKLEGDISELKEVLASEQKIKQVISDELAAVNKKHVTPRKTGLVEPGDIVEVSLGPKWRNTRHHDALARRLLEEDDRARAAQGHHAEVQGW